MQREYFMTSSKNQATAILLHHYFYRSQDLGQQLLLCPIDPVKIANSLKIDVYGRGGKGDASYAYSGSYRNHEGQYFIEFNTTENLHRQRMVVAYALGLYACKQEGFIARDFLFDKSSPALDFANELILPASILNAYFEQGVAKNVEEIALRFGVSKDKIGWRMIELGLV